MANPLFSALGGQQMNPMAQLVADARKLRQTMQNPVQKLNDLCRRGRCPSKISTDIPKSPSRLLVAVHSDDVRASPEWL